MGVLAIVLVAAACSSDGEDADTGVVAPATPSAAAAEATPVPPEPTSDVAEPTDAPTEAPAATPDCASVPTFFAADTVSVACVGSFAVSPELFAQNAGWHVFSAQAGSWVEVDYALTCCGDDTEATFVELLARNAVDDTAIDAFCAQTGLSADPTTGCQGEPAELESSDRALDGFEPTWLRVNGLGDHDFDSAQATVIASVEAVFGPATSVIDSSECGAGPMVIAQWDEFSLNFQQSVFVGWFYSSSDPALTSPSGVAPGIVEADLVQVYQGVDIFDETLGREFVFEVPAGFMGGFIDDATGAVSAMYAGTNCFFR